ncbi:RNA polymerase sigma-70 factor [Micromonosporaceae bacterium DT55]|uniref:RNA polymerase sigma-70 factor n=1 Tax=Melissospora conviva TaxID=3388432 RepID=UPI003C255D4F
MTQAQEFEALRPLLFSVAYRILGSVSEAEDAVQETWLRYAATSVRPESLKAYLCTVVTRISIDVLRSARVRRETYVGPWFPEPLPTDPVAAQGDPERAVELAESVSVAALLLLERLSPLERAVFVLREVFGFDFAEVAAAVGRTEAACRQLAVRARRHMREQRPRFEADRRKRTELADRFFAAVHDGDVTRLTALLTAEVATLNDGGGTAGGKGGVFTAAKAARYLVAMVPPLLASGATLERTELNGHPGAILRGADGTVVGTWTLEIGDGRIRAIHSVTNPAKLRHLGPTGDLRAVLRQRGKTPRRPG